MNKEIYQYVRCLYCKDKKEEMVVHYFADHSNFRAIHPQKIWPYFNRGMCTNRIGYLMRGYVFLYANKDVPKVFLQNIPYVEGVLGYVDDEEGYLRGKDREFAELLLENNGILNCLSGTMHDGFLSIDDDFMRRFNAKILRVDKRSQSVEVSFSLIENEQKCWFGYVTPEIEADWRMQRLIAQ